ncbi:MAG: aspartate--tRNA(Asn) ligase [Candidatus Marsarchaeota archaeon]|nr:aspartate--tRNA(Asn) ligase [Candidatus Marsarchaeota archaeon]
MTKSQVTGFVEEIRMLGKITFLKVLTAKGYVQLTIKTDSTDPKILDTVKKLTRQSYVSANGELKSNPSVKVGPEMLPEALEIVSLSEEPLPLDPSGKTPVELETRLNWRSLDLRSLKNKAIFKVQSKIAEAFVEFFSKNGFVQVFTPALMGSPSEGGSEVFSVAYFDKEAFLRQDPQLHRDLTLLGGLDKIFEIGPAWRAELSHTPRHMCEHRVCAAEMADIKDEMDVIKVEEDMLCYIAKRINEDCLKELELFDAKFDVPKTPFPVIRFPEIYDLLEKLGKKLNRGDDYDRESEELLAKYVMEKYGNEFYVVNGFPFSVKPFYVVKRDDDPTWARSVDIMFRGMEISTGGQREHRYDRLMAQVKEKNMTPASIEWFTKFFRYGAPTLGGFSIGFERFTMQILGIKNIREATLYPRTPERLLP